MVNIGIILGNKLNLDNSASDELKFRLNKAISLYKQDIDKIICSGGYSFLLDKKPEKMESEVMKKYLIENGVHYEDIFIDTESLDTVGNLYYSSKILESIKDIKNVIIITSSYHVSRVLWLAKKILPEYSVKAIGSETINSNNYSEDKVLEIYKKMFGNCSNKNEIFRTICEYLPGYSKDPRRSKDYILKLVN